jgi:tetratricopeptide (TPR) repeat protein
MNEELDKLNELADFFRRMNSKILLLKLINQAKFEYDKYDYEAGRKSLIEAYLIDKKNPVIFRGLGCIKQFSGNFNSAVRYFNMALKYSDKKEVEYTLLGMAYYLHGKLDKAVEYFNLAIDKNDDYDSAYEGRNQAMLENHLRIIDLQESLKKQF